MHLLSGSRRLKSTSKWQESDVRWRRSSQNVACLALRQSCVRVHVVSSHLVPFPRRKYIKPHYCPSPYIIIIIILLITINLLKCQYTTVLFQCHDTYLKAVVGQRVWKSSARSCVTTNSFLFCTLQIQFCHYTQYCHVCLPWFILLYSVDLFVSSLGWKLSYFDKLKKQIKLREHGRLLNHLIASFFCFKLFPVLLPLAFRVEEQLKILNLTLFCVNYAIFEIGMFLICRLSHFCVNP